MKRNFETTDLVVAVGMIATLFGGYFLYVASFGGMLGMIQPSPAVSAPLSTIVVERQLQESIKQSINEQSDLNQKFEREVTQSATTLNKAMIAAALPPMNSVESAVSKAKAYKARYDGNVQYMLGKTIVNLTRQGMQSGVLTAENLSNRHNDRIIATAMRKAEQAEQAYARNAQMRMGNWIVTAGKQEQRRDGAIQQRLGQATVNLSLTRHQFNTQQSALQNQFKALVAASVRTGAQNERFVQLAKAEGSPVETPMLKAQVIEAGIVPEISTEIMVVAFMGLITIFMIGLSLPTGSKPREHDEKPFHPIIHFPKHSDRKAS